MIEVGNRADGLELAVVLRRDGTCSRHREVMVIWWRRPEHAGTAAVLLLGPRK